MGINDVTRLSDGDMANLIRNLNSRINSDTQNAQEHEIFTQAEMPSLFLHKPLTRGISPKHPEMGDGIMGEAVDVIQEDGTSKTAVIRYSRNNGNYKVQFEVSSLCGFPFINTFSEWTICLGKGHSSYS